MYGGASLVILLLLVVVVVPWGVKGAPPRKGKGYGCNCECGIANRRMRVVGGNETRVHEFPWLAGLTNNGEFHCGASLITRKHLITAAHCVEGFKVRELSVVLGDHDRDSLDRSAEIVTRNIRRVRKHEHFNSDTFNNDIAILELDEPVLFDSMVRPVCMPTSSAEDYTGKFAVVAGWGRTGENEDTSRVLRKAVVPVWSKKDCYDAGYGAHKLSENMFCAGYPGGETDACQGDSGGPLHVKQDGGSMELIGLVSWGRGCARPNLPGIYTKITNYLDWVQESLGGECLCKSPQYYSRRA